MNATTTAMVAVGLYYVGAALFKAAGARMEPLRGDRPLRMLGQLARSHVWLIGMLVFLVGLELQLVAFAELPLGTAMPLFASSLVLLLWLAVTFFGERLAAREWLALGLFALATLTIAASVRPGEGDIGTLPPAPLLLAVMVPSIALPLLLFSAGDRRPEGRHARPLSGVAYGLSFGVLLGAAEVAVKGLAILNTGREFGLGLLAEPYPYLLAIALALGLGQGMIAMQRCRMAICVSVCTIVAKTYLVLAGSLLYGGDWPADPLWGVLRLGGAALAIGALFLFPRYDPEGPGAGPSGGYGAAGRSRSSMTSRAVSISGRPPPR
ncbi:hypothetical protein [Spirillospora sp. NPDC029432]|uniref:hypothetical protein n=1 Tax=Spirillospora sp. NPDC029432 TaxID=3154599 RepID=UPI0034539F48